MKADTFLPPNLPYHRPRAPPYSSADSDHEQPLHMKDCEFIAGVLDDLEETEDRLVACIEGQKVELPHEMMDELRGLEGNEIVVARIEGKFHVGKLTTTGNIGEVAR